MITARIFGGLGNQLFIYASARAIAIKNNQDLSLDILSGFSNDPYKRSFLLDKFNINYSIANNWKSYQNYQGILRQKISRKLNKLLPNRFKFYWYEDENKFHAYLLSGRINSMYIDGYLQSPSYFSDIKNILIKDFSIITPPTDNLNLKIFDEIRFCENPVAIHIRQQRGHASDGAIVSNINNKHLPIEYYLNAISIIKSKIDNPKFFLFGDDLNFCKKHFPVDEIDFRYIEINKYDLTGINDFWLLQNCKHFILSNSTYAWWASYIANSKYGINVAPNILYWDNTDILSDSRYFYIL